jgi:heme oxygenase
VARAYVIDDGRGVKFYRFKNLEGMKPETIGDYTKLKKWYRAGMNAGVRDNDALKGKAFCQHIMGLTL